MSRARLIDEKQSVIARAAVARRELDRLRRQAEPDARTRRRIATLEREVEHLAAEEHRLRLAIDRAGSEAQGPW